MKTLALSIAGVSIRMELQEEVPMTDAFRPFLTEAEPVYTGRFRRVEAKPPGIHRLRLRQEGPEGIGHGDRLLQLYPDGDTGNGQREPTHQDWKIFMVMLSALFS